MSKPRLLSIVLAAGCYWPLRFDSTCDTREAAYQKRLLALAGCVYGVRSTPDVPVNVVTEAQLLDALSADDDPDSGDAESLPHIEATLVA